MAKIRDIHAREIFDSRSTPTVEVDIVLDSGIIERASVPSGTSVGRLEAKELRDGDEKRFDGKGITKAIRNIEQIIAPELASMEAADQAAVDGKMIELDGTENKSRLGANATLGVSLAVARAAAKDLGIPLYRYIAQLLGNSEPRLLPVPMVNLIDGGTHTNNNVDFEEFMVMPLGVDTFSEAIRICSEIYYYLKQALKARNYSTSLGDEGGFSPALSSSEEAIELVIEGIRSAGYEPGKGVSIALDPAASRFYGDDTYVLSSRGTKGMTSQQMITWYSELTDKYPIVSIEDGLAENDWDGWKLFTDLLGTKIQLVGDDIFVTNYGLLDKAIRRGVANSVLVRPNQVGTLTETLDVVRLAKDAGYTTIISHRAGETEDTTIADIAVGCQMGQAKLGSLSRTEHVAKYNQLLRIEEELGSSALYKGWDVFVGESRRHKE